MILKKDMEYLHLQVELDIMDNLLIINKMEKECINLLMETLIVANLKLIKDMEKGFLHGKMVISILVIFIMILKQEQVLCIIIGMIKYATGDKYEG